jgi:hypothetical protein
MSRGPENDGKKKSIMIINFEYHKIAKEFADA